MGLSGNPAKEEVETVPKYTITESPGEGKPHI